MWTDNFGRGECSAAITKISCAGWANKLWIRIFLLLTFFASVISAESFWALTSCRNSDFSELAGLNDWLNINFADAVFAFKLAMFTHFTSWFCCNALAGWLNNVFFNCCWTFLSSTSFCWTNVAFAWRCAVECIFARAAFTFLFITIGANMPEKITKWKNVPATNQTSYLATSLCLWTQLSPLATVPPGHIARGGPWTFLAHWTNI